MSILPCPTKHILTQSQVFASISTSPLAVLLFAHGLQTVSAFRENCNAWIGNDAFSLPKLTLCAVMAAQLPTPTKSTVLRGAATLLHLLIGSQMVSEQLRSPKSGSVTDVDVEEGCGNRGLLAMVSEFSPVVAVQ